MMTPAFLTVYHSLIWLLPAMLLAGFVPARSGAQAVKPSSKENFRYSAVAAIILVLVIFGCDRQHQQVRRAVVAGDIVAGDAAPGKILVGVVDSEWTNKYEVRPSNGTVALTQDGSLNRRQGLELLRYYRNAAVHDCGFMPDPRFREDALGVSPDGKYLAGCGQKELPAGRFKEYFQVFLILDMKSGREVFYWNLQHDERAINEFVWSPNSLSVALLTSRTRYVQEPLETGWPWAGDATVNLPHDTVYLTIIPVSTLRPVEYKIRDNVLYAFPRILDWLPN